MRIRLNQNSLLPFIQQQVGERQAFTLLLGLTSWLRAGGKKKAAGRMAELVQLCRENPELCGQTASLLCQWLCSLRLYPLFISAGIFARQGFVRELGERMYERINPAYKDHNDLRDVFSRLFSKDSDSVWMQTIPDSDWLTLFALLRRHTPEQERQTVHNHLRHEGFHAIEMLSIWVAAEALEPDLVRLDPNLLNRDSPFVALQREVASWISAHFHQTPFDDSHLHVMLAQCRSQVDTLRKKGGAAGAGSSLRVAHLLERLQQTLDRITLLLNVFAPAQIPPSCVLKLAGVLAYSAAEQHSVKRLWKRSVRMLSRSITQNTSDHGEHYIARSRKEYWGILYSAAGGGVLIALMSLFKLYLGKQIENYFLYSLISGLNYGLGFMLIFMLGFTVATKQPAMTASRFAAAVEETDKGPVVQQKLAQLLVDVLRSQIAAVAGNVLVAVSVAMIVALVYDATHAFPLLNKTEVGAQLDAVNPLNATLWYAAIAGVWLFCSGIISGYFDNRCNYLNLRMRLRHHPILKMLLPQTLRGKLADYWHNNYGTLMGNLCFGMLLGMTGFIGHALDLPFDIRHVAFSSANVGYAAVSGSIGILVFLQSVFFVLLIGMVNLVVSFSITLWVALRSRETKIDGWWQIIRHAWLQVKQNPRSLFLPPLEHKENKPAADDVVEK